MNENHKNITPANFMRAIAKEMGQPIYPIYQPTSEVPRAARYPHAFPPEHSTAQSNQPIDTDRVFGDRTNHWIGEVSTFTFPDNVEKLNLFLSSGKGQPGHTTTITKKKTK